MYDAAIVPGESASKVDSESSCRLGGLALLALVVSLAPSGPPHASESGCRQVQEAANAPAGQAGADLRAYVDPDTGELVEPPPPPPPADQEQLQSITPEAPGLRQVERADGSVVADIGDRFLTEVRVEVIDGEVVTCHVPVDPEARAQAAEEQRTDASDDDSR